MVVDFLYRTIFHLKTNKDIHNWIAETPVPHPEDCSLPLMFPHKKKGRQSFSPMTECVPSPSNHEQYPCPNKTP